MLNWGVISAGGIAYVFCNAMRFTNTGQIVAIASNTESRADKFVNDFGIPRQYSNYADLLADDEVDAVYISTIHPRHMEWTIRAAEAKKAHFGRKTDRYESPRSRGDGRSGPRK
jgi:predicted dehydrogenase